MKAFVTGGGGFLGRSLVQKLRESEREVVSYSRRKHPHIEALGARCVEGDLVFGHGLVDAMRGAEVVFHLAAKAGIWGPRREFFATNVIGTENVISAARAAGVPKLVFTSSPSVCFDGTDQVNAGNDLPYAREFLAYYPESKARAEELVLAANSNELATCALRPHLIVGPGDPHILPRLLRRARSGKLAVIGDGHNEVTLTDVENAAFAHLDAERSLLPDTPMAGKAYFVGQEEPVRLWAWIGKLLDRLGLPPIKRQLPLGAAKTIGRTMETFWKLTGRAGEPPMTRFLAMQLASSHSYDMRPARRDFGYHERFSIQEATERLVQHWTAGEPRA